MYLKQRDSRMINFISDFGCASSRQIKELFFPEVTVRRCQQRLEILSKSGQIQRARDYVSQCYVYYTGKRPKEILHMLQRVEFYIHLQAQYKLCEFAPEYTIGDLRSDAYFEIYKNGYALPYFLEVQISPYFRQDKYETLFDSGQWLDKWESFPPVIVVSDNKIRYKPSSVNYIQIGGISNVDFRKRLGTAIQ